MTWGDNKSFGRLAVFLRGGSRWGWSLGIMERWSWSSIYTDLMRELPFCFACSSSWPSF